MSTTGFLPARHTGFFALSVCSMIIAAACTFIPTSAFAAEIQTKTATALPGTGSCAQLSAQNYHPYIYEGNLHSFDVSVSDASYVAVAGTVGTEPVPFYQMTRRINPDGSLRIHVDIETTPLAATLPISLTLLSTKGQGTPVCVSTVVVGSGTIPQVQYENISRETSYPTQKHVAGKAPAAETVQKTTPGSFRLHMPAVLSRVTHSIQANACHAPGKAPRFWFIFLVLYVLALGAISLSRPPVNEARPFAWILSVLLIPALLFGAFWYVSAACGTSRWIPVLAFVLGLLGLLVALRGGGPAKPAELLLPEHSETKAEEGSTDGK